MAFSFPQLDRFGTGSLVTRVTNDITQVQAFVSLFVRGLIRTSLLTYTTQLLNGILMLVMLFQNFSRGIASWKRVKEVLESVPELMDGSFDGRTETQGEIEFRDVSFAYPGSSQNVLSHINLTIHKGETVAIMGATGCGKTSLVDLIPRFYDAGSGTVLVDGIDVKEYRQEALRKAHPDGTKIIIAQRIASVRMADRIVVLENGSITACGTHEELLKSCRIYQDIYHSQIGEEAESA